MKTGSLANIDLNLIKVFSAILRNATSPARPNA